MGDSGSDTKTSMSMLMMKESSQLTLGFQCPTSNKRPKLPTYIIYVERANAMVAIVKIFEQMKKFVPARSWVRDKWWKLD